MHYFYAIKYEKELSLIMKNRLLIIFGFLFFISTTKVQSDNLEPIESVFDAPNFQFEYYSLVRKVLMNGMSDRPIIRFLILPSSAVEEVVVIERKRNKYFIVHHKMTKNIWYTKYDKERIKVDVKSVEILENDVLVFKDLFYEAVKNKKYPDQKMITIDGAIYYFSVAGKSLKTGMVWSPEKGSKMGKLKEIGYSLINLVTKIEKGNIAKPKIELIKRIKKLTT